VFAQPLHPQGASLPADCRGARAALIKGQCWTTLSHTISPVTGQGAAAISRRSKPRATCGGKCNARSALSGIDGLRWFWIVGWSEERGERSCQIVFWSVSDRKKPKSADRRSRPRTLGWGAPETLSPEECSRHTFQPRLHSASASVCTPEFAPTFGPLPFYQGAPSPLWLESLHTRAHGSPLWRTIVSAPGSPSTFAGTVTRSPFSRLRRGSLLCPPNRMDCDQ